MLSHSGEQPRPRGAGFSSASLSAPPTLSWPRGGPGTRRSGQRGSGGAQRGSGEPGDAPSPGTSKRWQGRSQAVQRHTDSCPQLPGGWLPRPGQGGRAAGRLLGQASHFSNAILLLLRLQLRLPAGHRVSGWEQAATPPCFVVFCSERGGGLGSGPGHVGVLLASICSISWPTVPAFSE